MSEQIRVLLVDDEESFSKPMGERLGEKGFVVVVANSGPEAIAKAKECNGNFNVAVIDQVMGPPNGTQTMQNLRQIYPAIEVIILTAWADQLGHGLEAMDMGAFRYMSKTANVDELALNVELAARFHRERRRRLVFKAILDITTLMQSAVRTPELLVKILNGIQGLGYDRARLYFLNPDRTLFLGMAEVGGTRKPINQMHMPLNQDQYSQHLLREAQPSHFHKGQYPDLFVEDLEKADLEEWIELPLIFEGNIIGKITVDNKINRRSLTDQDMEDLMVLATQAAAAIIRSRQVEDHQSALGTLVQVEQKISEAKTQEELHDLTWEQAQLLLPGLGGLLVSEYDEPSQTVHFTLYHDQEKRVVLPPRSNWNGVTEFVLQSKEPLLLPDGDAPFREKHGIPPSYIPQEKCTSAIIVPMFLNGKVVGTINVMSYDPSIQYTVEHQEMFRAFANQVAVGRQNVRQLEEARELRDAVTNLANKRGKHTTSRAIVEEAHKLIGSDFTGLILQDEFGVLHKFESVHPPDHNDNFVQPRQQGGVTRTVIESRQPMIIPDTQQNPMVKDEVRRAGIRSMLAMPLLHGDNVLGVLFAHDFRTRYYNPHDINLWVAFAAQAAATLHNTFVEERRSEDARRLRDGLDTLVGRWNLQEAMTHVATAAKSIFCADMCHLAYVDPPTGRIAGWAWADDDQKNFRYESAPREDGFTYHVLRTKQAVFRSDVGNPSPPFPLPALLECGLKSFASFPLTHNGRIIAVLHCNYAQRHQPSDERFKTLFEAFSARAATALDNARRDYKRQIWQELENKISECDDLNTIYQLFAEYSLRALHGDFAVLYTYDPTKGTDGADVRYENCICAGEFKAPLEKPQGGLGGKTQDALNRAPGGLLIVNDLERAEGMYRSHLTEREGIKAFIGLRLEVITEVQTESRLAGRLFVNFREPTTFEDDHITGMRLAGERVAQAILRIRQVEALKVRGEELNKRLRAVLQIFRLNREHVSMQALLNAIAIAVKEVLGVDVCTVLEYDQQTEEFTARGAAGLEKGEQYTLPDASRFKQKFLDKDAPTIIPDADQDEVLRDSGFRKRENTKSTVVYPLRIENEQLGLLFADYRYQRQFSQDEMEAIGIFADFAAMVIHDTRLRQQLKQTQNRLERQIFLTWVSMLEDTWRHSLVQKASAIRNYSAVLDKLFNTSPATHIHAENIRGTIKEIDNLASEIANAPVKVPQSWEIESELFPLAPLLREVAQREGQTSTLKTPPLIEIKTNIEEHGNIEVRGFRRWIIYAFESLLHNARNAMPEGGTITITGRCVGQWSEVRIQDTGIGVPKNIRDKLFKDLIPPEHRRAGMGIGGLLVAAIVEEHGGTIELENPEPQETTILVRLPAVKK